MQLAEQVKLEFARDWKTPYSYSLHDPSPPTHAATLKYRSRRRIIYTYCLLISLSVVEEEDRQTHVSTNVDLSLHAASRIVAFK